MKISALRLFNVKRFAGRGIAIEGIGDGVNVLCAVNEFGKSTSFEALHALFFQPHSGTPGEIQKLRPYSGGSPLVEADIQTAEGRFRLTKQYYGGRSARVTDLATGRLVAQADEAENFIAGLIRGGTAGPAGLLWVRQGVTGLEKRSRSEEDGEKEVRRSLLESVQGEVEAVTGGRRMAEIMAAAQEALSELVTPTGRPRTGGRYAAAIEERDRLEAEEGRLAGEVDALRAALDRRAAAARRLAELDGAEDRRERRQAVETAEAGFDAARAHDGKLKTAEAELKLARERKDAADRDLGAFRTALAKAKELQERLREAERRRAEASGRRRDAAAAIEKAHADAEAAEAGEQAMRGLLARLDAALKAREAAERLAGLKERLSAAEAARRALEEGEARLALVRIPAHAVDELQALEVEIAKLRAVEEAARPSVAISYQGGAAGPVTMDGIPLADGEERGYDGQAELSVPGIGTLTLRSNRPARSDDRIERAEAKRRTLLASMGVDDLAAARERQVRAERIEAELRELRGRLSLLAPEGLARLRESVAALDPAGAELLELKEDPSQVRAALAAAEESRRKAKLALREAEPLRGSADDAFVRAETALASLDAERTQVAALLGPEEARDRRAQAMADALDERGRALAAAEAHAEALRTAAVDPHSAEAALKRARSVEAAAEQEINALRETIAGLNAEIRTRSEEAVEETWRETAEALSAATARVAAFAKEVAVLQRLASALEAARSEARELYLGPVMAELRPLIGLLFDDVSITFDERTLLPQTIRRSGQEEEVDRLSGGMREQLSVLTRLAFARLLARDGRPAPVILDDALVYSDDDRIEKMFDALHRQSRDQQIIVFSCRQRAFQKLGGNVLQMTDWQP
ncbi:AAA family ATPase [Propylenella binzhouense]|uniref:DNA-binding protein n=1 Tax=Propylenella binzhouense TaxID=2555902 RepID=A0A964T5X2_9HYPH|nr:DNA-binding protein [Propylenella binzhouense]MYZ49126.1 DNA-binding protein [Propylenella binzhouense]